MFEAGECTWETHGEVDRRIEREKEAEKKTETESNQLVGQAGSNSNICNAQAGSGLPVTSTATGWSMANTATARRIFSAPTAHFTQKQTHAAPSARLCALARLPRLVRSLKKISRSDATLQKETPTTCYSKLQSIFACDVAG